MKNLNMKIMVLAALTGVTSACSNGYQSVKGQGVADLGSIRSTSGGSNLSPANAVLQATADVKQLFKDLLGREADTAGLDAFVDAIVNKGISIEEVRKMIASSDEARGLIKALYQTNLKRIPSEAEVDQMVQKLIASHTLAQVESVVKGLVSANESFVQSIKSIFLDVLGRTADQAGLDYFVDKMANGMSLSDVRATVANSPEAQNLIGGLYVQYLKRSPTAAEMNKEISKLAMGQKLSSIASQLSATASVSAGFESTVKSLFQQMLLRNPESAGLDFWVQFLQNGGSIADLRKMIANSDEAKAIINSMYQQYLVRGVTAQELAAHTTKLASAGVNMITIENDIMSAANADATVAFVKNLYRSALAREVETGGLAAWVTFIRNNNTVATCQSVSRSIYNSQEFKNRGLAPQDFVESMYRGILGRPSETAGKIFWLNRILETPDYASKVEYFVGSDEAIARCRNVLGAR